MNKSGRVFLQPAYVLHRRAYRETSFLVDIFTPEYGRLTVIAKGVRQLRGGLQGLLQPFMPLLLSWSGKQELMTLIQAEANGVPKYLVGECLFAGLYLNELLMRLLQKWDAYSKLYMVYEKALHSLQADQLEESILRAFEKSLLEELGYGLLPKSDVHLHTMISADQYYRFTLEQGFVVSEGFHTDSSTNIFSGESLLAIAKENWHVPHCLTDAKRLIRLALMSLLGQKEIQSRKLFLCKNK